MEGRQKGLWILLLPEKYFPCCGADEREAKRWGSQVVFSGLEKWYFRKPRILLDIPPVVRIYILIEQALHINIWLDDF